MEVQGRSKVAIGAGTALGATVIFAPAAEAATFTVSNLNDSGPGSLRQAVLDSEAAAGADEIVFQSGLSGTITFGSQIEITQPLAIRGPGASQLALSGNDTTRMLYINTAIGDQVSVSGLTFRDGVSAEGGAIYAFEASLTVADSVLTGNNSTIAGGGGGAIWSDDGTLTVTGSTFTGNQAADYAGAVYVIDTAGGSGNEVVIQNSVFTGNQSGLDTPDSGGDGGAAYLTSIDGDTLITGSSFSNNSANGDGGALVHSSSDPGDDLTIENSTLSGNTSDPDGSNYGAGGAIWLLGPQGRVDIRNSTFSGNIAHTGGAIRSLNEVGEPVLIANSTITGNQATAVQTGEFYGGGGISAYYAGSSVQLSSTIVANNTSPKGPDLFADNDPAHAAVTFNLGFSLVENTTGMGTGTIAENPAGSNLLGIDPQLGALAANGGPTQTHLLAPTSPALDAGIANGLASDQRGFPRTADLAAVANRTGADGTDIGAVESRGANCQGKVAWAEFNTTDGNDTVTGTAGADSIKTGAGNDTAKGGGGKDCLNGEDGKDKLRGQGGKDQAKGGDGNDNLSGGGGKDTVKGGAGKDTVKGAKGKDTLKGNAGKDKIKAADGAADKVNCGGGDDKATVDAKDTVSANCENVTEK